MSDSKVANELKATASRDSTSPTGGLARWIDDFSNSGWPSIMLGIVVAGAVYPVLLGAAYASIGMALEMWRQPEVLGSLQGLLTLFGALLAFLIACIVVGGVLGAVWTGIVVVATLPMMHLFLWFLDIRFRGRIVRLGALYGGLVGFVAVLPLTLNLLPGVIEAGKTWSLLALLASGPGLATPLAQLGGAWGGRRAVQRVTATVERHRTLVALGWRTDSMRQIPIEVIRLDQSGPMRLQFGTRHLLWIVVWLSLLLSVIRLWGVPFEFVLPVLLGWLVYQAVTLWFGGLLVRRVGAWGPAPRPARST